MIKPVADYVIVHPKDENGQEIKYRFMLALKKKLPEIGDSLMAVLKTTEGIDSVAMNIGLYTIEVSIARTFDPEEVIAELTRRLKEEVLTGIVRPSLVVPQ